MGVMYLVYTPSTLFLKHSILNFHKCIPPLCFATIFYSFVISKFYTKWYTYTITIYQNCQPFWTSKSDRPFGAPPLVLSLLKGLTFGELLGLRNV